MSFAKPTSRIRRSTRNALARSRDRASRFGPPVPAGTDMGELLEDLGRRRRLQAASRDRSNKAPGGLAEVVLRPYREGEDRRVDDDQCFALARISSSSALSLRMSGGSAIDRADRIAFAAARLRSR